MSQHNIARALGALVVTGATLAGVYGGSASGQVTGADALQSRARTELAMFTNWLKANGVNGYIGEVGWPKAVDSAQWNALAQAWYQDAVAAGLWVTNWATGEWWGTTYGLSSYEWSASTGSVSVARPPSAVIEAQTSANQRGVNVNGADFGPLGTGVSPTSTLSNANPGVYDRDWHYDSQATFNYLASRGVRLVRLAFRWERIQPTLSGPLDATELGHLVAAVGRARAAGLSVVLNPQNYGAYWLSNGSQGVRQAIGSAAVSQASFADLWRRLSQQFSDDPGVVAYGLMNEPTGMAGSGSLTAAQVWEQASQAAVNAIRANGDTKLVMVPGYDWAAAINFPRDHPKAWIVDPANNVRYEAHQYFDRDSSGAYNYSYAAEVADAQARGYTGSTAPTTAPTTTVAPPTTTSTTKPPVTTTTPTTTTPTTVPPTTTTTTVMSGDTVAPTAPANLYANGARRKVLLAWSGSSDSGGSGLGGYEVWRANSASGGFSLVARPSTAAYSDVAVASQATYWYVVYAYDRAGNRSAASNVVQATPN